MNESGSDPAPQNVEPPGLPRWVKISGAVVLVLVLILVMLISGGQHGPGRHGAEGISQIPSNSVSLAPLVSA